MNLHEMLVLLLHKVHLLLLLFKKQYILSFCLTGLQGYLRCFSKNNNNGILMANSHGNKWLIKWSSLCIYVCASHSLLYMKAKCPTAKSTSSSSSYVVVCSLSNIDILYLQKSHDIRTAHNQKEVPA